MTTRALVPLNSNDLEVLSWYADWTPGIHRADWDTRRSWPPGFRYMEMRAAGFPPEECPKFRECDPPGQCDVCQIADDDEITKEQRANADFIAASREAIPALIEEIERLRKILATYTG